MLETMQIRWISILSKNTFFQEYKLKIETSKLMEEIFMVNQLMILIKQYNEVRKVSTGQGDYYTTGCLLDYAYFKNNYRPIAADLSKQKALDADPRAIQQIIFTGKANRNIVVYYILKQAKETIFQFSKGTTNVL